MLLPAGRAFAGFTVNGGTVTFNNNAEFRTSTITINSGGVLAAGEAKISVSADWINAGLFEAGTSTVAFENGVTTSALTGDTTFYSFACEAAGKNLIFAAGSTQAVNGSFLLTGAGGDLIKLRSSIDADKWYLSFPNGAQTVSYVDVKDSDALLNTVTADNSLNSGNNNANWAFGSMPNGCGAGFNVAKDGSGDHTSIQAAVNGLSVNLSTTTCVVIRDTETYSEQVTVQGFANNGYQLKIMADPAFISSAPVVNPPVASTAAFQLMNDSVTVQGIDIISTNTVAYGIKASSASIAISSVNVDGGAKINTAGIALASYNTLSYSSITVQDAYALYLPGSIGAQVSYSTAQADSAGKYALYLDGASSNTFTIFTASNTAHRGASLRNNSNFNDITLSTMTGVNAGLELYGASSNTISSSLMTSPSGLGLAIGGGANFNFVTQSIMAGGGGGVSGLNLSDSEFNTISQSYMYAAAGYGAYFNSNSDNNSILQSTMTGYGGSSSGLSLNWTSSNTIDSCYLQGVDGAEVFGSTGTVVKLSALVATDSAGIALRAANGNLNLTLSSSTLSGGAQGAGVYLDSYNSGAINFSSNTISGGQYGLNIATQSAGATLSIASMTFNSLTAGATAVNFLGGQFVSTFTGVNFADADIVVNVNGSLLAAGSRITIHKSTGIRNGPAYETDPGGYVDWPSPAAVGDFAASADSTTYINLSWTAPGADGDEEPLNDSTFTVHYTSSAADAQDPLFWSTSTAQINISTTGINPGTAINYAAGNLQANTTYYFRLWTKNSIGNYSPLSNGATAVTLVNQVTGVQVASVYFTSVTVSWTALPASPSSATCEGYMVQASTAANFSGVVLSSASGINAIAALIVSELESDATYYFRVGSLNWGGKASFATTISTVTMDNIPPGAVSDLAAGVVSSDTVALTWTSAGDNDAAGQLPGGSAYKIQYSTYTASWSTASAQVTISTSGVQPGSTQYYAVAGLLGNTTYYLRLWTNDEAGNFSALSNGATALTLPQPVSSPQISAVYVSSFTIAWDPTGNLPGTFYLAETSNDTAFTLNTVSTVTVFSTYTFTGLAPNNVYFARVKTLGLAGVDSDFVSFGSTPTLANQPAGVQTASVQVTSITASWDANSNPDGTLYEVMVSSDNFATVLQSASTSTLTLTFSSLTPNSTYYFKAAAINSGGIKTAYTVFPGTYTYASAPAKHATSFPEVSASSVTAQWLANGNPAYTSYYVGVTTAADFTGLDYGPASWGTATSIVVSPLDPYTTYYFRAKAKDFLGREMAYTGLGSTKTLAGTDIISPSVTDLQSGDDAWRGSASGAYKVYFADYGSGLSKFQVRITTASDAGGTLIADWTDVVTNIAAQTYGSDWQLPGSAFGGIPENTTCYVSVRVYDNSANVTVSTDVFYVLRDITAPTIDNKTVSTATWVATDQQTLYDVDFADSLSGLRYIQYSASSQQGTASANILGWLDIDVVVSSITYTTDWGVNFAGLLDSATNYISAWAIDVAGNITTVTDAFRILKNTKGPTVSITSPNALYISTITAVSGSATKRIDIAPVEGSELAFMRTADAKYWDGAGFNSAAQFWLTASGIDTWSVDVSTFGLVENSSYTAVARARDINGKYSAVYATFTFTIDATAPTVFLSTPAAGATLYAFEVVEGTAADTLPGAGLSAVEISLKRVIDGKWWNFMTASWGDIIVSSRAAGGTNWQFYPDAALKGNVTNGLDYFVTAQAKDGAYPANASPFGQAGSTFTIIDTVPPGQVTQISASSGTSPGRIVLEWTASGDDGPDVMLGSGQFAIQYATWSSVSLSTSAAQVLISTAGVMPGNAQSYTVTGLTPSTTYYLALWVKDDADLWSDPSPLASSVSGESLNDQISGHVRMPSGQGITGVFVEAVNIIGLAARTAYTVDDGLGTFTFSMLEDGIYRLQATWVANNIASSVSKDQIPMGYADVDFILSTEYELASISGTIPQAMKRSPVASHQSPVTAATQSFETVELYQGSRRIAVTRPDALGNFAIRNLLPGTYTVRFPQNPGLKDITVTLKNGENAVLSPLGELLKKDSVYAYPNPARNSITFHLQSGINTALRKIISIFGIDGRLVGEIKEDDTGWQTVADGEWKFEMNTKNLASGVYIYAVKVQDGATGSAKKIIGKFAIVK